MEWQFLQELKEKGISMSEYLRTTMKTTPRYQDFIRIVYGNEKLDEAKAKAPDNGKPSLPSDSWNSIKLEQELVRDARGTTDVHPFDPNFTKLGDVKGSVKSDTPKRTHDKYTGVKETCPDCRGLGEVDGEYCTRCRARGTISGNIPDVTNQKGTRNEARGVESDKKKHDNNIVKVDNGKIDSRFE